jgi:hypothetical protein
MSIYHFSKLQNYYIEIKSCFKFILMQIRFIVHFLSQNLNCWAKADAVLVYSFDGLSQFY